MEAYYKMESVEHFAIISLTAHQLGGMKLISPPEVKKLETIREKFGIRIGGEACMNCGSCTDGEGCARSTKSEYEDIVVDMTNRIMEELKKQQ